MTRNTLLLAVPACIALQLAALPIPASGQGVFGSVDGVTRDSTSKQPVAHVRITAYNVSRGTNRTAISGPDGTFNIAKLEPGLYQVAAVRDGFAKSTASVQVAAPETYRVDLLLAADYPPASEAKTPRRYEVQLPIVEVADEIAALKARIGQLESAQKPAPRSRWKPPTRLLPRAAACARAGSPAPAASIRRARAYASPAPAAPSIPDALMQPPSPPGVDNDTPFAYGDFTWLNGTLTQQRRGSGHQVVHPGSPV